MSPINITKISLLYIICVYLAQAHTSVPLINTLYVEIGTLYPRSDFAGVIIDLNVQDAITRGTAALKLTDTFLHHHTY